MRNILTALISLIIWGCSDDSATTSTAKQYKTVIDEGFEYIDETTWLSADWSNGAPFYSGWCPEQISFTSGTMAITLEQTPCHDDTHASGEYRTWNTYKYGRYSVRMKGSDINGTISSMFTYTGLSEETEHDEIDIELFGKDPTKMQVNYWRNGHEHPQVIDLGFDASKDFHDYAFVWSADFIKWYVDGTLVHTVTENGLNDNDSLPVNAGKIMLNFWAGTGIDDWAGSYTDGDSGAVYYDSFKFEEAL